MSIRDLLDRVRDSWFDYPASSHPPAGELLSTLDADPLFTFCGHPPGERTTLLSDDEWIHSCEFCGYVLDRRPLESR